jgi:hypothetical protein
LAAPYPEEGLWGERGLSRPSPGLEANRGSLSKPGESGECMRRPSCGGWEGCTGDVGESGWELLGWPWPYWLRRRARRFWYLWVVVSRSVRETKEGDGDGDGDGNGVPFLSNVPLLEFALELIEPRLQLEVEVGHGQRENECSARRRVNTERG